MDARARARQKEKLKRQARVKAGLCAFCPNPLTSYKFLCDPCEDRHRQKQRKYVVAGKKHGPPRPPEIVARRTPTPALLGGAQNMMLPEFIIQQVQSFLNWGLASAGAALLIVITLVLFYFYLKLQPESPVGASNAR